MVHFQPTQPDSDRVFFTDGKDKVGDQKEQVKKDRVKEVGIKTHNCVLGWLLSCLGVDWFGGAVRALGENGTIIYLHKTDTQEWLARNQVSGYFLDKLGIEHYLNQVLNRIQELRELQREQEMVPSLPESSSVQQGAKPVSLDKEILPSIDESLLAPESETRAEITIMEKLQTLQERLSLNEEISVQEALDLYASAETDKEKEFVVRFVKQNKILEKKNDEGKTPLFEAVISGDFKTAAALIDCGASLNTDDGKKTLLLQLYDNRQSPLSDKDRERMKLVGKYFNQNRSVVKNEIVQSTLELVTGSVRAKIQKRERLESFIYDCQKRAKSEAEKLAKQEPIS